MGPGQQPDLDRDRPDVVNAAAVHADALVEDELADRLLVDEVEQALADARLAACSFEPGLRIAAIAVRPNALGDRLAEAVDSAGQVRREGEDQLGRGFGV